MTTAPGPRTLLWMRDAIHDPGASTAAGRLEAPEPVRAIRRGTCRILLGTASWTDKTMTAPGVFYPDDAKTPEARLRYYASRFPLVEVDSTYYALPAIEMVEHWMERTPRDFTFDIKAHALMTGHATETKRLPKAIREALPDEIAKKTRVYPKELPKEIRDEVWSEFRHAIEPLHDAGKLGTVMLQFPPWVQPAKWTPEMLSRARARLGELPIAVEFRNPKWMAPRIRERVWSLLRELGMSYVIVDTPPDTNTSMPPSAAVTNPRLAVVRLHGRRSELWGTHDAPVVEKYRYLYDRTELEEWLPVILELAEQSERLHVVFNNCYANYGATNAVEMARLIEDVGDA